MLQKLFIYDVRPPMSTWGNLDLRWKDTNPLDNGWIWTGGPWGGPPVVTGSGWMFNIHIVGGVRRRVLELHLIFPPNPMIPHSLFAVLFAPPGRWSTTGPFSPQTCFAPGAAGKGSSRSLGDFVWRA